MTTVNTTKYEFFTDKEKIFTDIYYKDENKETKTEMVFDRIAYKYTHTEPYENEFRSSECATRGLQLHKWNCYLIFNNGV